MKMSIDRTFVLAVPLLLVTAQGNCLSTGIDWLQVSGFISQGAIYTSDNNFLGETDDAVDFDFREVGAVVSASPSPALRFSTQVLSRKAGDNDDGSLELDHAVVSYDFVNRADWTVGVRAGRMKSVLGWYNETRDAPFTRPSIFLAPSVYAERVRNSYFFQDGIMLRGEWRHDLNSLSWHAGFHRPRVDKDEIADIAPLPNDNVPDTEGKDSWSSGLVYDVDAGRVRLGAFYEVKKIGIDLGGDLSIEAINLADFNGAIDLENRKTVLSFEYNLDRLSFVAERSITRIQAAVSSQNPLYAPIAQTFDQRLASPAYYYQVTYRSSERWDIFARYDRFAYDGDDKDGEVLAADVAFNFKGLPPFAFYSKDYTVGVGWHPDADWLVRAEWHNVEGTGWLNGADNEGTRLVKYWDMFALQLSYRF